LPYSRFFKTSAFFWGAIFLAVRSAKLEVERAKSRFLHSLGRLALFFFLLTLVVMPLDGKEHAGAEDGNFERNEDDRNQIHHFEYFQTVI